MCVLQSRILSTPGLRGKLDKLMAAKGASFEKEAAYRASQACGGFQHVKLNALVCNLHEISAADKCWDLHQIKKQPMDEARSHL